MAAAKERWRVSIKAQIKILHDLNILNDEYAVHLYKMYFAKGWTKEEPYDRQWTPSGTRVHDFGR